MLLVNLTALPPITYAYETPAKTKPLPVGPTQLVCRIISLALPPEKAA